jgi:hypothetical protein
VSAKQRGILGCIPSFDTAGEWVNIRIWSISRQLAKAAVPEDHCTDSATKWVRQQYQVIGNGLNRCLTNRVRFVIPVPL